MSLHYHNYKAISENSDGLVEVCVECKHRLTTKKDINGRIDNKKWLSTHQRDTAQPNGRTGKIFKQYYGNIKAKGNS